MRLWQLLIFGACVKSYNNVAEVVVLYSLLRLTDYLWNCSQLGCINSVQNVGEEALLINVRVLMWHELFLCLPFTMSLRCQSLLLPLMCRLSRKSTNALQVRCRSNRWICISDLLPVLCQVTLLMLIAWKHVVSVIWACFCVVCYTANIWWLIVSTNWYDISWVCYYFLHNSDNYDNNNNRFV